MNKHYDPGDRVITDQDEHGKVICDKDTACGTQFGYIVELDNGTEEHIPARHLKAENLSPDQIATEITNLKNLIKDEASKISKKLGKEIPEHLTYLQNALISQNKSESENEYIYILREMEREFSTNLAAENLSFKKLKHCWEKSLK
jgi:vacuolar-type H+-ATPase subunit H